jgi:signal transduction histidine kinase
MASGISHPFQDDVVLEGLGQRVADDASRFFSKDRLESAAVREERERLARELHDGVLQSLTGAALQLNALAHAVEADPRAARVRLGEIEALISDQQRELRAWIESRLLSAPAAMASTAELTAALDKLCRRAEWQWGLRVQLEVDDHVSVPRVLGDAIHRIFQEGLSNIGRHARARVARLHLCSTLDRACITIADDGVGFPICGSFDLAALDARDAGPASLRKRVASLGGTLQLASDPSGSRLDIGLPLNRFAWPHQVTRSAAA